MGGDAGLAALSDKEKVKFATDDANGADDVSFSGIFELADVDFFDS